MALSITTICHYAEYQYAEHSVAEENNGNTNLHAENHRQGQTP
jgi:hypothetical protein